MAIESDIERIGHRSTITDIIVDNTIDDIIIKNIVIYF